MVVGDGLPCGFAYAKSSRTSLRAVEPDGTTPRHFMPYTAAAVISSTSQNKKRTSYEMRCFFKMVVGDGFEPSKAVPADLQSAPFSHSGIPPDGAGKGGRTPLTSLEGWCTADMPYPLI